MTDKRLLYFALGALAVVGIGAVSVQDTGIQFPDGSVQTTAVTTFYERGFVSVSSNSLASARATATEVPLFSSGPFDVYGKCFKHLTTDEVYASAYVRTSKDLSLLDNADVAGTLGGGAVVDFFNTDTVETERQVGTDTKAGADKGSYHGLAAAWGSDLHAISPDGESLFVWVNTAAANSPLAAGDGPYLPGGDSCIWQGYFIGTS